MKLAVISEALADEAAVKILVDAILGVDTSLVVPTRLRPGGWSSVFTMLPAIIKDLHYNSDADGVVVVVDSDESTMHSTIHEPAFSEDTDCRLCALRTIVTRERARLSPVATRIALKVAMGLAVPSIEAWYRCGLDPHVTEFEWARRLRGERLTYSKESLKDSVYGSHPVSSTRRTELTQKAANRLAADLEQLERRFPDGFGTLLRDLRGWL